MAAILCRTEFSSIFSRDTNEKCYRLVLTGDIRQVFQSRQAGGVSGIGCTEQLYNANTKANVDSQWFTLLKQCDLLLRGDCMENATIQIHKAIWITQRRKIKERWKST